MLTLGVTAAAAPARAGAPAASGGARTAAAVSWSRLVTDTGFVLAVSGGRTDPGAPVIGWTVSTASASQAWNYYQIGGTPYFAFRSATTSSWYGLAISGGSTATGAKAIQWNFEAINPGVHEEQQWDMWYFRQADYGPFLLKNVKSQKCLQAGGERGTDFTQQTCSTSNRRQQFTSTTWY